MIKWGLNLFLTVLFTMVIIYFLKKYSKKYNIPFLKKVATEK